MRASQVVQGIIDRVVQASSGIKILFLIRKNHSRGRTTPHSVNINMSSGVLRQWYSSWHQEIMRSRGVYWLCFIGYCENNWK